MGAAARATEMPDLVVRLEKCAKAASQNADMDRRAGHVATAAVFDQYASLLEEGARAIRELRTIAGKEAKRSPA